ncbi:MAG: flagellar biosynthesis anti-sigma factor FlgM [Lachnospiraceae bacterium]
MRIGAYNQVAQVYGNQPVKKSYNQGAVGAASGLDQVSFSTVGKDMQIAKTALSSVPDVREDRVQALKESIANGTYQVSAESFADKLLAAFDEKSI